MESVKKLYLDNLIVITICLFVIAYVFVNYETIKTGVFPVVLAKPFLMSAMVTVILYLVFTFNGEEVGNGSSNVVRSMGTVKHVVEPLPPVDVVKQNVFLPHVSRNSYGLKF
jgi:hypothetical protein